MPDSSPSAPRCLGSWRRTAAWLLVLIAAGCSADQRSTTKGMPAPSRFAGSWMMSESAPQEPCVTQLWCCCPVPIETEDAFGSLIVKLPAKTLLATINNGVLTMADVTSAPSQDCSRTFVKTWTGVLGSDGRVTGEWVMTVTSNVPCDPGPACTSQGTFTWTRCPDGGCEAVLCLD